MDGQKQADAVKNAADGLSNGVDVTSFEAIDLIWNAGPVVQFVLIVLVLASLFSWAVIISKSLIIRRARSKNTKFLEMFWQGKSLDEIFDGLEKFQGSPIASSFRAGFRELKKLTGIDQAALGSPEVDSIDRALQRASHSEVAALEKYLGWLATIASAAPFIGLFGTVWGIMNAFQDIGKQGAANLATVAPGISEALIATAIGLAAAIPAVIFYNHLVQQIKRIVIDMDCFSQDFLNIIHRSFLTSKRSGSTS